jgi:flagellar biosynthesis/type III secretory pathway protein FliH
MDKDFKITIGLVIMSLLSCAIGYAITSQESYNKGYEIGYNTSYEVGYQEGITDQAQVDQSLIILGLINIPHSGYYIVNQNYGNFKLNVTNQTEALKYLQKEISPCL